MPRVIYYPRLLITTKGGVVMAALSDEMKQKISEGMKRAHARRKRWKKNGQQKAPAGMNSLLGHLRAERAELDLLIQALEKRGYK